ncbi:vWA domain-containing protein [Thalassoroseus pseudoceratinae]|uniref:vWA domain-containing protein n=1 Tax=Thalassoroseus pseudoceratinae TaxID=2713176 RepID=UPI00141E7491|nr:vWA domain-containing protein [Thalassoroseus pseudoceratinae]
MKAQTQVLPVAISTVLHGLVLFVLWKIVVETPADPEPPVLETVLNEERIQEEFQQELDEQLEAAETVNFVAGGSVSSMVGATSSPVAASTNIETSELLEDPEIEVVSTDITRPGDGEVSLDIGEGEISGEVGAVVAGYGPALDRLVQELMRMMRSEKVLVVWMFDESESMKDDQEQLKSRLHRVYEELGLVETDTRALGEKKKLEDILLTAITSFGNTVHEQTKQPTGKPDELLKAIERIPIDKTGDENLCAAILQVINRYHPTASRQNRKLVLVVVSDESGDDGQLVEEAVFAAKKAKSPIYVLGREAVFGSLYAHVKWKQPETGRTYYLPIRRGPETPFAEQLQWDGYRRRRDSQMSGFGPYEQVRLARDTGGIFFQLPGEQENLNDLDDRKLNMLNLREYLPNLDSRREYAAERDSSKFRKAIWDVIALLNPYNPNASKFLEIPDPQVTREQFPANPNEYGPRVAKRLQQVVSIIGVVDQAQQYLENVRPLRDKEPSVRWRANYDLIVAQLWWYKLRLFAYGLEIDQFVRADLPKRLIKNPKHNRWNLREKPSGKMIKPDERQSKLLKVTEEDLTVAHDMAVEKLKQVIEDHPESPWSRRAEFELNRRFGVSFSTWQYVPRKPSNKPRPKPTPPPKL